MAAALLVVNSDTGTTTSSGSSSNGSNGNNSKGRHQDRTTITLSDDPSFEMLVLGCGGGPSENDLSAYWIRPSHQQWSDGFTSLDGGSCLGALMRLLVTHPETFHDFNHDHHLPQQDNQPTTATAGTPPQHISQSSTQLLRAGYIHSLLQSFLITHAHWDHISVSLLRLFGLEKDFRNAGLVLSSGSGSAQQKTIYGSKQTISNLSNAMNGGLWPVLGSYEAANGIPYLWRDTEYGKTVQPSKGLTASIMPVSHGQHPHGTPYESSAYFIQNDRTKKEFLIFGDVEPDSVSGLSLNRQVWRVASHKIANGTLSTIFIECSYCSSRPKEQLYGHLSPIYLAEELASLARLILPDTQEELASLKGRLKGVTVCIIHVKPPSTESEILEAAGSSTTDRISSTTAVTETSATSPRKRKASNAPLLDLPSTVASVPSSRKTRSGSLNTVQPMKSDVQSRGSTKKPPTLPSTGASSVLEGIKAKIYNELQAIEAREQLGVRYLMLEQGMRIAF